MNYKPLYSFAVLIFLVTAFVCGRQQFHNPVKAKPRQQLGRFYWIERESKRTDTVYFSRQTTDLSDTIKQIDTYAKKYTQLVMFCKMDKHFIYAKGFVFKYDVHHLVQDTSILIENSLIAVRKYYLNCSATTDVEHYYYCSPQLGLFMIKSIDWGSTAVLHTDNFSQNRIIDSVTSKLGSW